MVDMIQSFCVVLLATVTLAQFTPEPSTTPRRLKLIPEIDLNDEGCGGEEVRQVVFRMPQLGFLSRCQQLTRGDCISYDEAVIRCRCTCRNRKRFKNPNGVLRDDYKATTVPPELVARPALNFSNNTYFNWPDSDFFDASTNLFAGLNLPGRRRRRAIRARRSARRLAVF